MVAVKVHREVNAINCTMWEGQILATCIYAHKIFSDHNKPNKINMCKQTKMCPPFTHLHIVLIGMEPLGNISHYAANYTRHYYVGMDTSIGMYYPQSNNAQERYWRRRNFTKVKSIMLTPQKLETAAFYIFNEIFHHSLLLTTFRFSSRIFLQVVNHIPI